MTQKNPLALQLIAGSALALFLGFGAPSIAQDRIEWIDGRIANFTASRLASKATEIGESIVTETVGYSFSGRLAFFSARLESSALFSLDDLASGLDLEYVYAMIDPEIPPGFYVHHVEVSDPTQMFSPSTHSLVGPDGDVIGVAEGQFDIFGQIPDPSEPLAYVCETSSREGTDEVGGECLETVTVCTEGATLAVIRACFKSAE